MPSTLTRAEAQAAKQAALDLIGGSFDAVIAAIDQNADPCPLLEAARDACDDLKSDITDLMVEAGCSVTAAQEQGESP